MIINKKLYRAIRLIIGILILWQALDIDSIPLIILGLLFIIAPLFNIGCTTHSCRIPERKKRRRR